MKQTITPERLLGEYIGTLRGICAWDIPEQLREKLERRAKELQELQIEMEVQHKYNETERGEPLYPHTLINLLNQDHLMGNWDATPEDPYPYHTMD